MSPLINVSLYKEISDDYVYLGVNSKSIQWGKVRTEQVNIDVCVTDVNSFTLKSSVSNLSDQIKVTR